MSNAETIAAGLTHKQAAAVRGIFAWSDPFEQEAGEDELYRLKLWDDKLLRKGSILTPLGLEVRAILEKSNG